MATASVALVSGAASNIGLAIAQAFAVDHTVIMADKADLVEARRGVGANAVSMQGDVTSPADCAAWVAEAQRWGALKAVIHAAAITMPASPIEGISLEQWELVIRVEVDPL
jgi:3-oxoacyl-[acyl-carrier protein] reductase